MVLNIGPYTWSSARINSWTFIIQHFYKRYILLYERFQDADGNIDDLLKTLEKETTVIFNWFKINEMKSNDDKCHVIVCNQENVSVTLGNKPIENSSSVELLSGNIDTSKLR